MAKALKYSIASTTGKRVLLVSQDPWLRFRLQREFEYRGCEVVSLIRLRPSDLFDRLPYDLVLTDAASIPEGSRLEALRALRNASPHARFVLLVDPGHRTVAAQARASGFDLVLDRPARPEALPPLASQMLAAARPPAEAVPVPMRFQFLMPALEGTQKRRAGSGFTSLLVHALVLAAALLVPLLYTESIDLSQYAQTWLVAPPPPPPPPPPPAPEQTVRPARRVKPVFQTATGQLIAPTVIPKEIAKIVESTEVELDVQGVLGGVPGGVPGGQLGGVLGGVLGGIPSPKPGPVPPPPPPQKPVRVGGNIQPPKLIRHVEPVYPSIARQARIQGDVRIDAIISTSGRVVEMKVLSGHPLLVRAALDAVRRWLYEPTLLNEQPIPVVLEVTVRFRMH